MSDPPASPPRVSANADPAVAWALTRARVTAGLDRRAVALEVQVSGETLANWERARSEPRATDLIRLARLYRITLDQLLGV